MHWLKCCEYNNKDENNCPNTLNDKNYQASSQKFRQIKNSNKKYFCIKSDWYFNSRPNIKYLNYELLMSITWSFIWSKESSDGNISIWWSCTPHET